MSPKRAKKIVATPLPESLPPAALYRPCDPESLNFKTTDELPDLQGIIGQPRAIRAMQLGSEVSGRGYNTFVLGAPGSGRTTLSREFLEQKAAAEPVPDDWCYVNNFENPRCPKALRLPAGWANELRKDIRELIERCQRQIGQVFESEEYTGEREALLNRLKAEQEAEFSSLQAHVEKYNFLIGRTPTGFVLVPSIAGKPLKPEDVELLSAEQRAKLEQLRVRLSTDVEKTLQQLRDLEKVTTEKLAELDQNTMRFLLLPLLEPLQKKYAEIEAVLAYLATLEADLLANAIQFRRTDESSQGEMAAQLVRREWSRRYQVNVLVDNSNLSGAPVIVESHPSYPNLAGRIEHEMILGATQTDFTLIHPGALHRANGGYLVIPARDLIVNPYAWEGLKRVLRDGEIRIIEINQQMGLISAVTLEPEPIPLNLKIVLIGTHMLYYSLRSLDEDFAKLFKVRAEFAGSMERVPETEYDYGLFVKSVVLDNDLPAFDNSAVARIIEYSARLAEDQEKLSTRFGHIADIVREAAYWARQNQAKRSRRKKTTVIDAAAVERAITEGVYRQNLLEERLQQRIEQGIVQIQVRGAAVGQINALSVIYTGEYAFGKPNRISAVAYPGRDGVVDIERQANLGGRLHTKGVLILTSLLGQRFGHRGPLNLTARLTFEQVHDEIEGDSASAAEYYALLSAVGDQPLRQDRAITGAVDQHGRIQAIGAVNQKIEGFFAVCKARGLTGKQGVIIPASNSRGLMLNLEVRKAVERGRFHIWPVERVEEGLALLSELPPGEPDAKGDYPEGSFNYAVAERLKAFNEALNTNHERKKSTGKTQPEAAEQQADGKPEEG